MIFSGLPCAILQSFTHFSPSNNLFMVVNYFENCISNNLVLNENNSSDYAKPSAKTVQFENQNRSAPNRLYNSLWFGINQNGSVQFFYTILTIRFSFCIILKHFEYLSNFLPKQQKHYSSILTISSAFWVA